MSFSFYLLLLLSLFLHPVSVCKFRLCALWLVALGCHCGLGFSGEVLFVVLLVVFSAFPAKLCWLCSLIFWRSSVGFVLCSVSVIFVWLFEGVLSLRSLWCYSSGSVLCSGALVVNHGLSMAIHGFSGLRGGQSGEAIGKWKIVCPDVIRFQRFSTYSATSKDCDGEICPRENHTN